LSTEEVNPRSRGIDARSTLEILRIINEEDQGVPGAVREELQRIAEGVEVLVETLRGGGRVLLVGAGSSGRIGAMEAIEMPPTFGVDPERFDFLIAGGTEALMRSVEKAENDEEAGRRDVASKGLGAGDLLIALSASGSTPYVLGALKEAESRGVKTIAIVCASGSLAEALADLCICPRVGPEVVAGSTRMKAGTAQKLTLNMMTTAAMIRLGRVYDGYMIGVQPRSRKLWRRALVIISHIAGVEEREAERLLKEAGGDIPVAILMAVKGCQPDEARRLLEEAEGSLRRAMGFDS
jgi:N-acetylmuramic acid 6-phosphate etherase